MKEELSLTILEKLQFHKLMWLWLAENLFATKIDWWTLWWNELPMQENNCFLCDIYRNRCVICPLMIQHANCGVGVGPFQEWRTSIHYPTAALAACKIANCANLELNYCLKREVEGNPVTSSCELLYLRRGR